MSAGAWVNFGRLAARPVRVAPPPLEVREDDGPWWGVELVVRDTGELVADGSEGVQGSRAAVERYLRRLAADHGRQWRQGVSS